MTCDKKYSARNAFTIIITYNKQTCTQTTRVCCRPCKYFTSKDVSIASFSADGTWFCNSAMSDSILARSWSIVAAATRSASSLFFCSRSRACCCEISDAKLLNLAQEPRCLKTKQIITDYKQQTPNILTNPLLRNATLSRLDGGTELSSACNKSGSKTPNANCCLRLGSRFWKSAWETLDWSIFKKCWKAPQQAWRAEASLNVQAFLMLGAWRSKSPHIRSMSKDTSNSQGRRDVKTWLLLASETCAKNRGQKSSFWPLSTTKID